MSGEDAGVQVMLKTAKGESRIVIGARSVKKSMARGKIEAVICSSSCRKETRDGIANDSKLSGFRFMEFTSDSSVLGELCGKPFNVSVVGIRAKEKAIKK